MRFYKQQHKFYCGVDLHTKQMYCCIVDSGVKRWKRNSEFPARSMWPVHLREDQFCFDLDARE